MPSLTHVIITFILVLFKTSDSVADFTLYLAMSCVPGHWVPPLLMTVFLLIANILLISMLIAIFK